MRRERVIERDMTENFVDLYSYQMLKSVILSIGIELIFLEFQPYSQYIQKENQDYINVNQEDCK